MLLRIAPPRNPCARNRVVIRGTVVQVTPGVPARYILGYVRVKEAKPPVVTVRLDEEPYRQVIEHLTQIGAGRPAQTFRIGWKLSDPPPNKCNRVWATFSYANGLEGFFEGTEPISFDGLEVIKDEREVREHEIVDPQMYLTLATA